jgi:adenine-specific DNA-methyltransferase
LKVGSIKGETTPIYYLTVGEQQKIDDGIYEVLGRAADGSVLTSSLESAERRVIPSTQWKIAAHDSTQYGSRLLQQLMPDRRFPFPKSLYAVEDALRFFLADKQDAVIIDFFAGSGTTAHAVMRLNRQDGGRRQCVLVTNNEVAADEQTKLRADGLRPGESEWEKLGIFEYITKPRLEAAVTGQATNFEPIKGSYKFTDEFPMGEGFDENVRFLKLTYEAPLSIASNRAFDRIAPVLWMRSSACGEIVDDLSSGWFVVDTYAVIADFDKTEDFLRALADHPQVNTAFVLTSDDWLFESICRGMPEGIEPVRLYEAYLRNFEIEAGRAAR